MNFPQSNIAEMVELMRATNFMTPPDSDDPNSQYADAQILFQRSKAAYLRERLLPPTFVSQPPKDLLLRKFQGSETRRNFQGHCNPRNRNFVIKRQTSIGFQPVHSTTELTDLKRSESIMLAVCSGSLTVGPQSTFLT